MNRSIKIFFLFSFFLLGIIESDAQCVFDNEGRKLTKKQLRKVQTDAPIIQAIQDGDMLALKAALKRGVNVNARDCDSGTTALILTIINSNPEMMRILISHKANVNLQNNSGFTALMYAVGWGRLGIVKELLAAGADVNIRRKDGDRASALTIALRYPGNSDMVEIVKILRASGAKLPVQP